jgi:Domain of unknown function (DUF1929)/Acetamidase/Formamidase family
MKFFRDDYFASAEVAAPRRFFATTAICVRKEGDNEREDVTLAARNALLNVVDYLGTRGCDRQQAYALCSCAVDLRSARRWTFPTSSSRRSAARDLRLARVRWRSIERFQPFATRFQTARQLCCWAGMTPTVRTSEPHTSATSRTRVRPAPVERSRSPCPRGLALPAALGIVVLKFGAKSRGLSSSSRSRAPLSRLMARNGSTSRGEAAAQRQCPRPWRCWANRPTLHRTRLLGGPRGLGPRRRSFTTASAHKSAAVTATAPANANVAPPGVYMLFAIGADGVPSVARMVHVAPPPNQSPAVSIT